MDTIRVLTKPTYSITLFFLVIGTLAFFYFAVPSLIVLQSEGKLVEGIAAIMSALAVITPLGFGLHQIQAEASRAALKQSENSTEIFSLQLMQNIIFLNLNNQETILSSNNRIPSENQLRASDLSDEDFKKMIPPELESRTDLILSEARKIAEHVDLCRSIAKHLEASSETLKFLAVEASDEILTKLSNDRLQRLGLLDLNARGNFYGDIYLYIRGWLKSSIEFDIPMPVDRIVQSNLDRKLYLDTLNLIREAKINQFGLTDERQINIVRRYLNILIDRLET